MMRTTITTAMVTLALSACGQTPDRPDSADTPTDNVEASEREAIAIDAQLPALTILRVKLNEAGNEVPGAVSLRTVSMASPSQLTNGAQMSTQFARGAEPTAPVSELDADTSAQAWHFTTTSYQTDKDPRSQDPRRSRNRCPSCQAGQTDQTGQTDQGQGSCPSCQAGQTGQADQADQGSCPSCQAGQGQGSCPSCQAGQGGSQVDPGQTRGGQPACSTGGCTANQYPVRRQAVTRHTTRDVYPQRYVDVYPVETVRIHPEQTHYRVHPVQQRIQYVSSCARSNCQNANYARYFPTVSYRGYQQYYYYARHYDYGGYRYYSYCKPWYYFRYYY